MAMVTCPQCLDRLNLGSYKKLQELYDIGNPVFRSYLGHQMVYTDYGITGLCIAKRKKEVNPNRH